jgi:hypothetical protein
MGVWASIRSHVSSADAIYGTILFAALIAVSSDTHGDSDGIPGDSTGVTITIGSSSQTQSDLLDSLVISGTTLLIFWLAHVYARAIAGHGAGGLRSSIWKAFDASAGMLYSVIPTTIVLLLGIIGVLPDAADWSLLVTIVVLGLLGYQSFAQRGGRLWTHILGAVVSALLGLILVILNASVH